MVAAAALALVAGRANAQDAGWDSKYGAIFGIGVSPTPLQSYEGKIGLQYNMAPETALRLGVRLARGGCGGTTTDHGASNYTTKDVCGTLTLPDGTGAFNSTLGIGLSGEYLVRASSAAVAPYFGAGAYLNFDYGSRSGTTEDSRAGATVTKYANSGTEFGLGLLGKAGLEWRLNKVVAVYAEYKVTIDIISRTAQSFDQKTGTTVDADGGTTKMDVFNLSTGVTNGGAVGLVAFF
jgi:hypothetical protein